MKRLDVSMALLVSLLALAGLCPAAANPPQSCTDARWIGLKKAHHANCPNSGEWKGSLLFARVLASMPENLKREAKQLGLGDFCVYEPPGAEQLVGNPARVTEVPTTLVYPSQPPVALVQGLRQLKRDCPILAGAGDPDVSNDWPRLEAHFLDQAGQVPLPPLATGKVWLTFVDTQPTGESPPRREFREALRVRSMHGYTLAHLADRLLCSGVDPSLCPVRVRTRLAMPMTGPSSEESSSEDAISHAEAHGGGLYGRLGDLSLALVEELVFWLDHRQEGERLVLNLSLGWNADSFDVGGDEARVRDMSGPAQAVYWSLQLARHNGALVVAASGNRRAGSDGTCQLPLLPAAWEVKPPAIGSPLTDWFRKCFTRWQRVPVRAGGAVQSEGFPLPNARPCSLPPRVAYGDHVVVETRDGEPTAVLTGTSAGAAVISASAAAVWTLWPKLSAERVIDLLYRSGDPLGFAANLYEGGGPEPTRPAPQARRVSLCRSVVRALDERPGGWGDTPRSPCREWDRRPLTAPHLVVSGRPVTSPGGEDDLAYCSSCATPKPPPDGSTPLTRPQPEEDPCTTCSLTGGGGGHARLAALSEVASAEPARLVVDLKPGWSPVGWEGSCPVLESLVLEIDRFDAVDATLVVDRWSYPVIPLSTPEGCLDDVELATTVAVEIDDSSLERTTARLRFQLRKQGTEERTEAESPVLIQRQAPAETDRTTSLH